MNNVNQGNLINVVDIILAIFACMYIFILSFRFADSLSHIYYDISCVLILTLLKFAMDFGCTCSYLNFHLTSNYIIANMLASKDAITIMQVNLCKPVMYFVITTNIQATSQF